MKTITDMYKLAPLLLAAVAAAAPSLPETCTNLPEGFCSGAMVPNVAYTVPAMYGCANKCKEMNIWCQADKEGKAYEYLYCCDNKCVGFPKEKKCTVEGKEYTVGQAYEVTLKGQKECVTMWCINEKEYRTCRGKECGCKPELTPPPPQVCKKPTPCLTCPPVPPKPQPPKPECSKHRPCPPGSQCVDGKCVPFLPPCFEDPDDPCLDTEYWNTKLCICMPLQTRPLNPNQCYGVTCDPDTQILNYANCECVTIVGADDCDFAALGCTAVQAVDVQACKCVDVPNDGVKPVQCNVNSDCAMHRQCSAWGCTCQGNTCVPNENSPLPCAPVPCLSTEYWNSEICACVPLQTRPGNDPGCDPAAIAACTGANKIFNYDSCSCVTVAETCTLTTCPDGEAVDVQICQCVSVGSRN